MSLLYAGSKPLPKNRVMGGSAASPSGQRSLFSMTDPGGGGRRPPASIRSPYLPKVLMPDSTWSPPGLGGGMPAPPVVVNDDRGDNKGSAAANFDYSHDPVLQAFDAQSLASRGKRSALDLERQKRILLGFGSRSLAEEILGEDDPFLGSVSDDPDSSTSALAQLGYNFRQAKRDTIEDYNQQNLFWGGHHLKAQEELARERLLQEAGLATQTRDQLSSISEAFEEFLANQREGRIGAEAQAYQNAIEAALRAGAAASEDDSEDTSTLPTTPDETATAQTQTPPQITPPVNTTRNHPAATPDAGKAAQTAKTDAQAQGAAPDLMALAARSAALNTLYQNHIAAPAAPVAAPAPVQGGLTADEEARRRRMMREGLLF